MKKRLVSFVLSLIVLLSFGSFMLNSGSANASKKSSWIKGNPKVITSNNLWATNFRKSGNGYERIVANISKKFGFQPIVLVYNKNKKFVTNGSPSSAAEGANPYYKKVGKNLYQLISGGIASKKHSSLYYDFHIDNNDGTHGYGEGVLVKYHNKNHISVWWNNGKSNSKKTYSGYYTRMTGNKNSTNKNLKTKWEQ